MERHKNQISSETLARKIEALLGRSMHIFMEMIIITATLMLKLF